MAAGGVACVADIPDQAVLFCFAASAACLLAARAKGERPMPRRERLEFRRLHALSPNPRDGRTEPTPPSANTFCSSLCVSPKSFSPPKEQHDLCVSRRVNDVQNPYLIAMWHQLQHQRRRRAVVGSGIGRMLTHYSTLLLLLLLVNGVTSQLKPPITSQFKCLPNGCCDQHEWCRFWASIGECKGNPDWMGSNCQLACSTCPMMNQNNNMNMNNGGAGNNVNVAPAGDCNAIRDDPSTAAIRMLKSGLVNPIEDISSRVLLSIDDITRSVSTGCVPQLQTADCQRSLCYHMYYRSFDGTCNNLNKPLLGAAFRPYLRHLPPEYDNGVSEPVSSLKVTRPTPREVTRVLLSSAQNVQHDKFNSLLMQWGQFMSHDMAKTTLQPSAQCTSCDPVPSKCVPVRISALDTNQAFKQRQCLKISRSAPVCGTGQNSPREQLNENTGFIDASMIYGSSSKDLHKFRDGRTGLLKMDVFNNQRVLPFDHSKCGSPDKCSASFTAGDIRANLFIGLASMHILFAREHNRIATILSNINPGWSGDRVFQEGRKIVGAQVQAILYREFLPKILGNAFDNVIGPYKGYNPDVNPTVANVFTTSAYRFGHGMLQEFYRRLDFNGGNISQGGFNFGDGVFKSGKILFEGGIDPILRGFMATPVKRPHRMTPAITERMFGSTDLGTLNIMRGREHGIPSYNKWRKFCGHPFASNFDDFGDTILDGRIRAALARNYQSPDNVDLYVGAMVEDPVIGGLVGQTLACIIGDQFKRSRDGDRFYFENQGIFTPAQLDEIKKTSMARVLCNSGDHFELVSQDAFILPQGQLTPCNQIPQIDLSKWKD
ncbi:hypothetical protein QR680_001059 [Steinernema hermaphroditum]|uniref:peroxidase n=1 Tax=Steinernema hermaphroditum TaxID=289476 RepID=A0AA39GZL1_9BILA|nr:hypothetical protein QR680_001059 [Steinernema hermaphroditum]